MIKVLLYCVTLDPPSRAARRRGHAYTMFFSEGLIHLTEGENYHITSDGQPRPLGPRRDQPETARGSGAASRLRSPGASLRILPSEGSQARWIFERETLQFLEVNNVAIREYGYSEDEFRSMKITDILTPEDTLRFPEYLDELRGDGSLSSRWRHKRKDGSIMYVQIASRNTTYFGVPAVAHTVFDISSQKPLEERLKLYREIIMNIPISLAVVTRPRAGSKPTFKIVEINPAFHKIAGGDAELLLDKLYHEKIELTRGSRLPDGRNEFLISGDPTDLGEFHTDDDQERGRILSGMAFPLPNDSIGIALEDVTEQRRIEDALEQSEQQYRSLFENNPQPMYVFDQSSLDIIAVNKAAMRHYGYSREEFLSLTIKDLRPAEDIPQLLVTLEHLEPGKNYFALLRHKKKDGSIIHVEVSWHGITLNGKQCQLALANDITARKRAEEEVKATRDRLRELTAHLQSAREEERIRIAREIHDELGQVITAVKMTLSVLARSVVEEAMPAEQIAEELQSMDKIMDSTITSVTRVVGQLRPVLLDEIGLVAAIKQHSKDFQERTGIQCEVGVEKEEFNLEHDRALAVFRIFQEALTNIARHSGATRVQIDIREYKDHILLFVKDNGRGITDREISSPKALGLMGIRERAMYLGGTVHIGGIPAEGTRILVQIPLQKTTE